MAAFNEIWRRETVKKMITFLLVLVTALSLTACGQTATSPDPSSNPDAVVGGFPQMEITIATTHPGNEQDPMYIYCKTFGDYVTKKTNGAVTFDISSDSVLGNDVEIAQGLAMGTLKMGITSNAAISTYEPSQNFFSLPFMFANADEVHAYIDSDIVKEMNDALYDDGLKVLSVLDGGFRQCLNRVHPINSVSDFSGLKWRVPPMDLYVTTFNLMGDNATPMRGAEVFTGLQQKTIDGCEFPISSIYSMQLYTAVDYIDITNHQYAAWYACVSDELWESLGEELQGIFTEAAANANEKARAALASSEETQLAAIEAYGCTVNRNVDTSGMREAVAQMYDDYRGSIGEDIFQRSMDFLASLR